MALGDSYLGVEQFRARSGSDVSGSDDAILDVLTSASRQIDRFCGQEFNKSGSATAKVITARYPDVIDVPNLVSVSQFATDLGARTYPTIWTATDYDLFPFDAVDRSEPYTEIRRSPLGSYSWPATVKGVKVTAVWGWPAVPSTIQEACYLIANRNKSLWNAPFGSTSAGELGSGLNMTGALDPIIKGMLMPYRVVTV